MKGVIVTMRDLFKLPEKVDIYAEFEANVKKAAMALYGLTLGTIATETNLVKVDPGEELEDLAMSIGCAKLAQIVAAGDASELHFGSVKIDTNLAVLIMCCYRRLVTDDDFNGFHIPDNHVPEGFREGLPQQVENEAYNIPLNAAASV